MKKLLLPALAALAVVFIATLSGPAASGAAEKADAEALFVDTHECNMCHSVAAAKIPAKTKSEKLKGPDLSGFQTDHSLEEISAYVRK
ncbi:MAG: hypothetical protein R3325_10880, partial [Thermoanaerobaculia bacterium]|nr:hypothetical protein [Thermoanaerobaculia bacterium]